MPPGPTRPRPFAGARSRTFGHALSRAVDHPGDWRGPGHFRGRRAHTPCASRGTIACLAGQAPVGGRLMTVTANSATESAASFAMLFEQIVEKLQSSDGIDVEAYVQQYPEHAERLRRLLPACGMLAELGRSAARQEQAGLVIADSPGSEPGVLGDFRIVREIGRGGMGVVYEAVQISL